MIIDVYRGEVIQEQTITTTERLVHTQTFKTERARTEGMRG